MYRSDGLDNPFSPNGPGDRYFVRHEDGTKQGPYSCPAEASEHCTDEDDVIVTQTGRVIDYRG
jgi:hypothetical protein